MAHPLETEAHSKNVPRGRPGHVTQAGSCGRGSGPSWEGGGHEGRGAQRGWACEGGGGSGQALVYRLGKKKASFLR